MASAGGSILSVLDTGPDIETRHLIIGGAAATAAIVAAALCLARILQQPTAKKAAVADEQEDDPGSLKSILIFAWTCFFKPHEKSAAGACDGMGRGTQQAALESFYRNQARVYDRTRKTLLKGREDMLALVAAQLKHKAKASSAAGCVEKRIWVDVGRGYDRRLQTIGLKSGRHRSAGAPAIT